MVERVSSERAYSGHDIFLCLGLLFGSSIEVIFSPKAFGDGKNNIDKEHDKQLLLDIWNVMTVGYSKLPKFDPPLFFPLILALDYFNSY